jgi:DNA-binding NarL/FixJ family response regulator
VSLYAVAKQKRICGRRSLSFPQVGIHKGLYKPLATRLNLGGLPLGLEAADGIRQVTPDARIIFLTQNSDRDVVRAALRAGARGYVLKADAGNELFSAVEAVIGGDDFVSRGIKEAILTKPKMC